MNVDIIKSRDAERQRVAEGMSRWCNPQSPHLGLDAELSTALAAADRAAARLEEAAARLEEAAALPAAGAAAKQLADVVRVLKRIYKAAKAGKEAK